MGAAFLRESEKEDFLLERGTQAGHPKKINFHNFITPFPLFSNTPILLPTLLRVLVSQRQEKLSEEGFMGAHHSCPSTDLSTHLLSCLLVGCLSPPLLGPISVHPLPLLPGSWLHCPALVLPLLHRQSPLFPRTFSRAYKQAVEPPS